MNIVQFSQSLSLQCLLCFIFHHHVRMELFSSVSRSQEAVHLQQEVVRELDAFLESFSEIAPIQLHQYLNESLHRIHPNLTQRNTIQDVVENPILGFQLIKYQTIWPALHRKLTGEDNEDDNEENELDDEVNGLLERISALYGAYDAAAESDFEGIISSLVRLQAIYELPLEEFVQGIIGGVPTNSELSANDVYLIGNQAYESGQYGSALKWLAMACRMSMGDDKIGVLPNRGVLLAAWELLKKVRAAYDDHILSPDTEKCISDSSHPFEKQGPVPEISEVYIADDVSSGGMYSIETARKYIKLCQKATAITMNSSWKANPFSNLTCQFWNRDGNPYLLLMPIKMEFLHPTEPVYLMHDAIRENTIEEIKISAEPKLYRGVVGNSDNAAISSIRTAQVFFLQKEMEHQLVNYRMTQGIRLNLEPYDSLRNDPVLSGGSESLQASNYGIGGHYLIHKDCHAVSSEETDTNLIGKQRLATLMFYLSNVKLGGATVFPNLGIGVHPEKGAALFWYNTLVDGDCDPLYEHAACPILIGDKWVANKWIHYRNQRWSRQLETMMLRQELQVD